MSSAGGKTSDGRKPARVWTGPQRVAIEHGVGDLVVSAAAGSGKTAVLAERCARLVCREGHGAGEIGVGEGGRRCGVENLLVLTFTDAAASEMRGRIAGAIQGALREREVVGPGKAGAMAAEEKRWLRRQVAMVERAGISTLHAFCMRVLRQHFHEAQVDPAFEVIDAEEARLVQEEVLEGLFGRWHRLPAGKEAEEFAEFFEAYAQGSEANCQELILRLYRMLASTADPARYIQEARQVYAEGKEGCQATMKRYVSQTLVGQLRVAGAMMKRVVAEVEPLGVGAMLEGLQVAAGAILEAQGALERDGVGGWGAARGALTYKWKMLKSDAEVADFAVLKKRYWEGTKTTLKELAGCFEADPAVMVEELGRLAGPLETLLALAADFQGAYAEMKRGQNAVDFNDLERLTLDLLRKPGSLAAGELRQRYRYILVDEFQDINPLQEALLMAVRSPGVADAGNLFVVGDVKQSIYGFRLAEPGLFLAREGAARRGERGFVALPHNFRSHGALIGVMNGIFKNLLTPEVAGVAYGVEHALVAGAADARPESGGDGEALDCFSGVPVEVHLVAMKREEETEEPEGELEKGEEDPGEAEAAQEHITAVEAEAQMVAERIAEMLREGRGVVGKDGRRRKLECRNIGILLRSMRAKAMIFARALARRGIGVHADLSTGYFDTTEVRETLALLHVLDNPRQDIPMATALLGPYGHFSHDDLAEIRLTFDRREVPFAEAAVAYATEETRRNISPEAPPFSEALASRLRAFFEKLGRWRERMRSRPLHEGLAEIYGESKILAYVSGLEAGVQRVANMHMLHQRALKFAGFRKQGLHRFLRFIEKIDEQGGDLGEAAVQSEASDVVRIMSVHKSKGLEFPVVFVSGLGSKLRLSDGGMVMVHRDFGVGLRVSDVGRNVHYASAATLRIVEAEKRSVRAEELRLLYVAMTRARECLVLTGHIGKEAEVERWRKAWGKVEGPLPEDVLLKGARALDWVMPAVAMGGSEGLRVNWDGAGSGGAGGAQVEVTLHEPGGVEAAAEKGRGEGMEGMAAKICAGEAIGGAEGNEKEEPRLQRLIRRVTERYPQEAMTQRPAVQTVSFLKTLDGEEGRGAAGEMEAAPAAGLGGLAGLPVVGAAGAGGGRHEAQVEAARQRGIATHRVMELLDLANCDTAAAMEGQVGKIIEGRAMAAEEVKRADWEGIRWFLWESEAGRRVIATAKRIAGGDESVRLRREIAFTWVGTPMEQWGGAGAAGGVAAGDPADWPTIRGVIDLLIVDRASGRAEIIDYKTDSAFLWETRVGDYQRQMRYYQRAAGEILGFKVERATLIFLSPREAVEVKEQDRE